MPTIEEMRHNAAVLFQRALIATPSQTEPKCSTKTALAVVDALEDYFLALATNQIPKPKPEPDAARLALAAQARPDDPPDCKPCAHQPVYETLQNVHCAKCQRSGTYEGRAIRWSD